MIKASRSLSVYSTPVQLLQPGFKPNCSISPPAHEYAVHGVISHLLIPHRLRRALSLRPSYADPSYGSGGLHGFAQHAVALGSTEAPTNASSSTWKASLPSRPSTPFLPFLPFFAFYNLPLLLPCLVVPQFFPSARVLSEPPALCERGTGRPQRRLGLHATLVVCEGPFQIDGWPW